MLHKKQIYVIVVPDICCSKNPTSCIFFCLQYAWTHVITWHGIQVHSVTMGSYKFYVWVSWSCFNCVITERLRVTVEGISDALVYGMSEQWQRTSPVVYRVSEYAELVCPDAWHPVDLVYPDAWHPEYDGERCISCARAIYLLSSICLSVYLSLSYTHTHAHTHTHTYIHTHAQRARNPWVKQQAEWFSSRILYEFFGVFILAKTRCLELATNNLLTQAHP